MSFLGSLGLRLELGLGLVARVRFNVQVRENRILNGTEFNVPTRLAAQDCACSCACVLPLHCKR